MKIKPKVDAMIEEMSDETKNGEETDISDVLELPTKEFIQFCAEIKEDPTKYTYCKDHRWHRMIYDYRGFSIWDENPCD